MRACLREQKSYGLRFSWFPMHLVCRVVEFSLYSQRAVTVSTITSLVLVWGLSGAIMLSRFNNLRATSNDISSWTTTLALYLCFGSLCSSEWCCVVAVLMVVLLLVAWLNIVYIAIPLYYLPLICVPQAYGNHFVVIAYCVGRACFPHAILYRSR